MHVEPFLLSQTPMLPCALADSRVHLKLVCLRMNFGKTLQRYRARRGSRRRVVPVGWSRAPRSRWVKVFLLQAMLGWPEKKPCPPDITSLSYRSLSAARSVTFLVVLQLAIRCLAQFARTVDRLRRSFPVRSKWLFGCTVQPLSLLRPAD